MLIRINKYISEAGIASRREADRLITAGEVTVNGKTITVLGTKCDPAKDHVKVRGKLIQKRAKPVYILLNKPRGFVTTTKDPEGRPTVMDLIKNVQGRVFPVGRIDLQTEGLLLLTNDGDFADKVMRPASKVRKIYSVKIRGTINENLRKKLEYGILVDDEKLKLDKVTIVKAEKNSWLEVTIHEGKNRHIRRIFDQVRHPVAKLKRIQIGSLRAPKLAPGEYMLLDKKQIDKIFERRK